MDHLNKEAKQDGLYERRTSLPRAIQLDLSQTARLICKTPSSSYDPDDEVFIEFEEWQADDNPANPHPQVTPRPRRTSDVIDSVGSDSLWPEAGPRSRRSTSPDIRLTVHTFQDNTFQLTPRSDRGYSSGSVTSTSSPLEPKWFRYSQSSDRMSGKSTSGEGDDCNMPTSNEDTVVRVKQSDIVDARVSQPTETEQPSQSFRQPQAKTAVAPVDKYSLDYNMSHPKRGIAVIFNHETFRSATLPSRIGSKHDVIALELFLKTVGFEVEVYSDLTCQQITSVLEQLSAKDHSDYDCVWVTVLTHGLDGQHLYAYDHIYSYEDLYNPFKGSNCLTLAGKPKIFVIQACRGNVLDPGVRLVSRTTTDSSQSYSIPSTSDFLIAFSTFSGFYAWRNPEEGTWYIQTLVKTLNELHTDMDFLSIMTRVACLVGVDYESYDDLRPDLSGMKQAPSVITTLTRRVNFKLKNP